MTRTHATTCSKCGVSIPGMTADRCPDHGGPSLGMTAVFAAAMVDQRKINACRLEYGDAHDEHMAMNGECPWCGTCDTDIPDVPTQLAPARGAGSHADCSHPATKAARAACRRARAKA